MGQHQKAKMMLEESLAISRRTLGEKSRAVAEALHYMSTLMLQMGDFQEGLKKMEEARLIFQDIPGNHRERLTHIASTMAFYRQRAGMMQLFSEKGGLQGYQESESTQNNIKMQLEALQACRAARKNDTDGQEVVELLLNVGTAYGDAGKEVEARAYYEEALEIIRRLHGDKHPLVAVVLTNIANSLARRSLGFSDSDGQNHLDEAYTIFEKVLKIRIRVDGEESEVVADTLLNMGTFLMEQGKTGDAVEKMEQAIKIFTRVLGKNHQKIAGAHFFLVKLRMLERDLEGALIHCEESVRMYKELGVGPNDVRLQETQKMLGMLQFSPPVRSNQSPPTSSKDHLHGLD
jgi:tetratricopeptide (TPR) repeat protein